MLSDKRIIKTRNSIKNAFMQLNLDTEIGKITVSDLAEKAQINRSTFYLHYSDVNAVMKDIEDEMKAEISSCLDNFKLSDLDKSVNKTLVNLTEMLNAKPIIKSYILDSTSSNYLISRLKEIFVNRAIKNVGETMPHLNHDVIAYALTYVVSGALDSYVTWAHSDNSLTLEELIDTVSSLTQQILKNLNII